MTFDPEFYLDWGVWAFKRVNRIENGAERALYLGDLMLVWREIVQAWDTLPKGGWPLIGLRLLYWGITNPDPLARARAKMREVENKWREE